MCKEEIPEDEQVQNYIPERAPTRPSPDEIIQHLLNTVFRAYIVRRTQEIV